MDKKNIVDSNGVNLSNGVSVSYGVSVSDGVNWSNGVSVSYGVNVSDGVNWSNGVSVSNGVNGSDGVNWSNGVSVSDGVNGSYGVNWSNGVSVSDGVNGSYGILNSFGVNMAIFLADKPITHSIFGKEVAEDRFNEVWSELHNKLNGWFPEFNTAFIWLKKEGSWEKVDTSKITSTLEDWQQPYEAWKDMPIEAIEYVKSLPEFDAVMFKRITGIDVESECRHNEDYNYCPFCGKKI